MKLDRVTITGADDSIDVKALLPLTEDFPFVEWGILFSKNHQATPRYPTSTWVDKLLNLTTPMKLSAHLCGHWCRMALAGQPDWWRHYGSTTYMNLAKFERIQLNFHGEPSVGSRSFRELAPAAEWIMQCDGVNDAWIRDAGLTPLFDTSGGKGLSPDSWPDAWPGIYCGYAGGLGPENIVTELEGISAAAGDGRIWIDMESRIRSHGNGLFDVAKVRRVLTAIAPFVSV